MNGKDNEFDFVKAVNRKFVKELDFLFRLFIEDIFGELNPNSEITSWRNHYKQKTDIFIKINGISKRISIKMGSRNSVHTESISTFISFLKANKIPNKIINDYLNYHYADGTTNNTGAIRLSSEDFKKDNQMIIKEINDCFKDKKLLNRAINRFVINGLVYHDRIDYIVFGTTNDFVWLSRDNIINVLIKNMNKECNSPHFSSLVIQPLNRCLNYNPLYEHCRNYIQVKWYSLFEDIIHSMSKW